MGGMGGTKQREVEETELEGMDGCAFGRKRKRA